MTMSKIDKINIEPQTKEQEKKEILTWLKKEIFWITGFEKKEEYSLLNNSPEEIANLCNKYNQQEKFLNICKQHNLLEIA